MSRIFPLIAALVAICATPLQADEPVLADLGPAGAKIEDAGGEVHVTLALSQAVPWRVRLADGPPRLIVEFHELNWTDQPRIASSSVAEVSVGKSSPGRSQLVAVLREPLAVASAEMKATNSGAVLELRLQPTTAAAFRADAVRDEQPDQPAGAGLRPVVAIDPGHGGIDPGAEAGDLDEAHLVLGFADRLRDTLLATGRFDVVLTREKDTFVSLKERMSRAREARADVFLSLHADALAEGGASGVVVYSLAPDAMGNAAERLTERHGDDDLIKGVDLKGAGDDVAQALLGLARHDTTPRTNALSDALVNAFSAAGLVLNTRPQRGGHFAVLKAADMPSVLLELGFISTEADLARLTSEEWQIEAALAVGDALMIWYDEDSLR